MNQGSGALDMNSTLLPFKNAKPLWQIAQYLPYVKELVQGHFIINKVILKEHLQSFPEVDVVYEIKCKFNN